MEQLTELTLDEKGQLHGGFALQSAKEMLQTYLNNTNGNCSNGGNGDKNSNCSCTACEFAISPNNGNDGTQKY